jgi:hypothetical protein
MKKILKGATKALLVLLVLLAPNVMAQEVLVPMRGNASLSSYDEYMRAEMANPSRAVGDTLSLPFFDDFSEPFSRLRTAADLFPNSDLWVNNKAYINNHMAINPISQGVATFDGLDERGRAYGFLLQGQDPSPQPADSLTSKPLDLSNAADTVYLSFYYQPQGAAPYAPGEEYKLVLEFKDTADLWETQWEAEGFDLEIFDFNRVMVPVSDERYLYSGFQFRFRNYTFLGGNVDQWHIDYVELDEGRDINDTIVDDVAILGQTSVDFNGVVRHMTSSILKEYNSMPWMHYKESPSDFMGDTAFFAIRNNTDELSTSGKYTLQIYNSEGSNVYTSPLPASPQVLPSIICGNEGNDCASPTEPDLLYRALDYDFPTDVELSSDSMFFELVHNINELVDAVSTNDRTSFTQEFYNYYAYDDGTAEAAYGLENLDSESMVALKYNIKKPGDRLVGIQYYLNPVEFDMEDEPVRLVVWSGNEEPEDILWQSPDTNLYYTNQRNYFHNYTINDTVLNIASENIWIGWVQQPSTDPEFGFSFGFDKRTDASSKLRLNLGSTWIQSSIPGAVMIRPVFGEPYDWVGVDKKPSVQHVKVYPNPTTGDVFLEETVSGQFSNAQISVFDLSGRNVFATTGYNGKLQLGHLKAGTYLLRIDATDSVFTERLVLQP